MKLSLSVILFGLVAAAYSMPIDNIEDRGVKDSIQSGWGHVKAKFHPSKSATQKRALPPLSPSPSSTLSYSSRALYAPTARALSPSIARRDAESTTEQITENTMNEVHNVRNSQSAQDITSGFSQVGNGIKEGASSVANKVTAPFKAAGHAIARPFEAAKNGVVGAVHGAKEGYENSQ